MTEEEMRQQRAQRVAEENAATLAIEKIYNRAVNECLQTLEKARIEAKTHVKHNVLIESQQSYIARLLNLENALAKGAQNPLGNFNWDFV